MSCECNQSIEYVKGTWDNMIGVTNGTEEDV